MRYIFISPHLDDAVLSCGGIIHFLVNKGHQVDIWTIFSGDPEDENYSDFAKNLHKRWKLENQNPSFARRREDKNACHILGAKFKHFPYQDCIYRKYENGMSIIQNEEDLFQKISGNQIVIIDKISNSLKKRIPHNSMIVSPFGIGNHIDHQIVKSSIIKLQHPYLWFYADFPYVLKNNQEYMSDFPINYDQEEFEITENSMKLWQIAVSSYTSQISTFWSGDKEMFSQIEEYAKKGGGNKLWKKLDIN
ncbi:MAG: PIG-L family deacetylase [Anaerolineaceae bacterium]|jgi:hypothetical protein